MSKIMKISLLLIIMIIILRTPCSADNHDNHLDDTADQFKDHDDDLEAGLCEILQKLEPWADSILSGEGRGPNGAGGGREQVEDFPRPHICHFLVIIIMMIMIIIINERGGDQPVREEGGSKKKIFLEMIMRNLTDDVPVRK